MTAEKRKLENENKENEEVISRLKKQKINDEEENISSQHLKIINSINLHFENQTFNPYFIHQIFDEEKCELEDFRIDISFSNLLQQSKLTITLDEGKSQKIQESVEKIKPWLPEIVSEENHFHDDETKENFENIAFDVDLDMIGRKIHSYENNNETFEVFLASRDDLGAIKFHNNVQGVAIWFIENADKININDQRWRVYYITKVLNSCGEQQKFALVGYFTVFAFMNPIKGLIWRICQALILPQYQRQKHGKEIFKLIQNEAISRVQVYELNLEKPASGFKRLRNICDYELCQNKNIFDAELQIFKQTREYAHLSRESISRVKKELKLTNIQIMFCYEAILASIADTNENKEFENMVKKRLLKNAGISEIFPKTERNTELHKMFLEVQNDINLLLQLQNK